MSKKQLKFMDFCSGIGAARVALENLGLKCVAHSEINEKADETYKLFFGNNDKNFGDLMKINPKELPDFDIMIAGFPCQTFSIAGKRKGFQDPRGTIIYGLIEILKAKKIKYFILENVKGLLNVDGGRTLQTILHELMHAGYDVRRKLVNSMEYGVPQMRERIYFVGVRSDLGIDANKFSFENINKKQANISNFLINNDEEFVFSPDKPAYKTFINYLNNKYNKDKYSLNKLLKTNYIILDTRQSDLRIYEDKVPTLRTGRHGIMYIKDGQLRKLSGQEALLLQGFPNKLAKPAQEKLNNTNLLSQAGNAMTVNAIQFLGNQLLKIIK